MKRDLREFYNDILRYAEKAKEIVADTPIEELTEFSNEGLSLARCMEVIGEAVKHIPKEHREKHPEVQWKLIAGMRDFIIHEYWNANLPLLVSAVRNRVPGLEIAIRELLEGV